MPKKKRTITVSANEEIKIETTQEPKKTVAEKVNNFVASLANCGHINKQSYNANNELEDLYCTLEKGHEGDHGAELDGKRVFWSDAAGTPARKHA